jgi:alginate O-acetyltransferase complex protein AlgI
MFFVPIYILILGFTIVIDFFAGIYIENADGKRRKLFLVFSLIANIGVLAVFKYYNFINQEFSFLLHGLGLINPLPYLSILLPIGLSFHTFQAMSYTIEVYRGNQKAERHFGIYSLYVMFYPQLVAGPIERPQNLLHQFREKHNFDYKRISYGLKLMFWGFFQKIVIADNMARFVDIVYKNPQNYYGWDIILVTVLFAIQIYADFSGYTDIARGAAKVLGINLMINFKRPYFASSIKEFWKRWHISLSSWFRDFVYFPLGGSKRGKYMWIFAIFLTFGLSGLWHGANWNYIIWGIYNAFLYLIENWLRKGMSKFSFCKNRLFHIFKIFFVFLLVAFGWMIFRSNSINDFFILVNHIFSKALFLPKISFDHLSMFVNFLSVSLLITVWIIERRKNIVDFISEKPIWQRWLVYYLSALWLIGFGNWGMTPFIYFQF